VVRRNASAREIIFARQSSGLDYDYVFMRVHPDPCVLTLCLSLVLKWIEGMSRVKCFFLFICTAVVLTSLIIIAFYEISPTYPLPRTVPDTINAITTHPYKSPIPPLIHQVFFSHSPGKVSTFRPSKYQISWQSSEFAYNFYTDVAAQSLIENHLLEYLSMFNSLPAPILRTDFFKYAVLFVLGGIYSDLDVRLMHPLPWPELQEFDVDMIIGIEGDNTLTGLSRGLQFESWTIASAPGHPILHCAMNKVRDQTEHFLPTWTATTDIEEIIMDWTGPGIWSDCITEYIGKEETERLHRLASPRQIRDVLILPRRSLSSLDGEELGDDVRGKHHFQGLWKKKSWWGRFLERFN
jgi:mannosyltransferase OCH1-like enzyme